MILLTFFLISNWSKFIPCEKSANQAASHSHLNIRIRKMQKKSTLSQKQLQEILQKYVFGENKLHEIIQSKIGQNCNLNMGAIIHRLCQIVRKFVLELEKSVLLVQKIKQVKIYDHESDQLFEKITLNLQQIVPQSARAEFMHFHKNINLNTIEIIWQTQYIFVHTDKKMEIYDSIINFCEKQNLFAHAHHLQVDPFQKKLPFQTMEELFPARDLELIFKKFRQTKSHVLQTYQELKKLQINGPEYKTEREFVSRVDNMLLIGVYQIHKLACEQEGKQHDTWEIFKRRGFGRVSFEPFLEILFRVAIRNDASPKQINAIQRILRKKCFRRYIRPSFEENKMKINQDKQEISQLEIQEVNSKDQYGWGIDKPRLYYDD